MARQRDERSKLIDNIGRQIRRLNAREKAGGLDDFQKKGIDRQRQNLIDLRNQVKATNKNDTVQLAKLKSDYKNNGNYTTSQKEIDQNTKRLIGTSLVPDEMEQDNAPPPEQGAPSEGQPEEGGSAESGGVLTQGSEGDSGDYGSEMGGSTVMEEFGGLFEDLAQLDGQYIGVYASPEIKDQVNKVLSKIKELQNQGEELNVNEEQREHLNRLAESLESAMNRKGNYSVRDESGQIIGYESTFNHSDFEKTVSGLAGDTFDVNKWISENIDLFPNTQSHPGTLSPDEQFERSNKGILGDWDF